MTTRKEGVRRQHTLATNDHNYTDLTAAEMTFEAAGFVGRSFCAIVLRPIDELGG